MINFATHTAEDFFKSRTAKIVPGLESSMLLLRRYFAVDNYYVKTKILKVLFPFRSKNWKRLVSYSNCEGRVLSYCNDLVKKSTMPLTC